MERGELDSALAEEIRARVLGEGFMKIVQTVRRNGKTFRISMRPVAIGGETRYQAEMVDDGQVRVKNFDANGAAEGLEEIIAQKDGGDDAADGGDHRACRSKDGGDCHDGQHRVRDVIQKRLDKPVLHLVFRQCKRNDADQIGRSGDGGEIEKIL